MTMIEITIAIPVEDTAAVAGILDMLANERRTPSGNISRSGEGKHTYVEGFRITLESLASQIRAAGA